MFFSGWLGKGGVWGNLGVTGRFPVSLNTIYHQSQVYKNGGESSEKEQHPEGYRQKHAPDVNMLMTGGGNSNIFIFIPNPGEDDPI